jgi:hypothetical protein
VIVGEAHARDVYTDFTFYTALRRSVGLHGLGGHATRCPGIALCAVWRGEAGLVEWYMVPLRRLRDPHFVCTRHKYVGHWRPQPALFFLTRSQRIVKEFNQAFSIADVATLDRNSNLRPAHCFVVGWAVATAPLRRVTMLAKTLDVVALQFLAVLPLVLRCWFSGVRQLVREMSSQFERVTFTTAVSAKRAGEKGKINKTMTCSALLKEYHLQLFPCPT